MMYKQRRCEICLQIITDGELNTGKVKTSCDQEIIDKDCGFAMVSRFRHKACISKANPVCKQCHGKGYIAIEDEIGREHEVTCKGCHGSGEDEDG